MPSKTFDSRKPHIIVTGANGFVGAELVRYFAAQDWHVRALVRGASNYQNSKNITYFEYDILAGAPNGAFDGADYLVHTAYMKSQSDNNTSDPNVVGAKHLLAQSRKHQLTKNIFMSSMSADEKAISAYGKQKFQIEKLFNRAEDVSLRCGLVIGNGGLIKQTVQFMRSKHITPLIDGGEQPLQVIGIHDLMCVVGQAIARDVHGVLNIGTPEVYTYREFYQTIRHKLGIKAMAVPVPFWLPLYVIRTVNVLHLPLHITEDNLWGLKKLRAFDTLPSLAKLGITLENLDTILDDPHLIS